MNNQISHVIRPVEKQPKRKLYLYMKRICAECGFIHLYRKVAEKNNLVRYGCVREYHPVKNYTISIYLTIAAETEEEAREIAFNLDVVPKNEADEGKIYWESQNTEVEEEPF
jgi:hypothetical protein